MAIIERENVAANPRGAANPTSGWGGAGQSTLATKGYAGPGEQAFPVRTVTNLIANPSFEEGIAGVSSSGALTAAHITSGGVFALEGTGSLRLTVGAGAGIFTFAYQQVTDLVAGEYLGASFWFRSSGGTYPAASRVIFFNAADANVGTSAWSPTATSANDWVEVRLPAQQIPATAVKANVYFYVGDPANGVLPVEGAVYNTDCWRAFTMPTAEEVNQALADRYFDGDVWYPEVILADWTGTSGASPSVADVASDATVNQVWNPRAVAGSGPEPWPSANATEAYTTAVVQDLIPGLTTGYRYTRNVATGTITGLFDNPPASRYADARPGESWGGGVLLVPSVSGRIVAPTLRWGTADGTFISYTDAPSVPITAGEPVWLSVAGTAPAQARTVTVGFRTTDDGAAVGDVFDMTAGLLVPGLTTAPAVEDYFDGSFGREGDVYDRYWAGLENASPSVRALTIFSPEDAPVDVGFQYALANEQASLANTYARHALLANFSPVEPGVRYGASMWMLNVLGAGATQRLRGSWRNASGGTLSGPGTADFDVALEGPPAEGWTLYSGSTPVAPEGAALLSLFPWWYGSTGAPLTEWGGAVAWTQAMLEPGVVPPGAYFDGSLPNTADAYYFTDADGVAHAVINTRPGKGAWAVELGGYGLEGGDGIVPTLLDATVFDGIVGCLTEPPDGMGLPPRRVQDVVLAQRDGVAMLSDFYENRVITIKATVSGGAGCEGCPTAKQNVRKLLRAWARYCGGNSALRIFTDCHGQGDVADVGPFYAIGRGRAAEVVWRSGGVQVADVTLRFDCVDHLLRFNPDPGADVGQGYLQSVDVPVLSEFFINYFSDPRGVTLDPLVWDYDLGLGEAITLTTVEDAEDGWLVSDEFPDGTGSGGMEGDGNSGGAFGEHSSNYARVTVTDAPDAGPAGGVMNMNSELPTVVGTVVTARFYVRSNAALPYTSRIYGGSASAQIAAGTLTPGEWTLISGTYTATAAGMASVTFDVTTAAGFPPIGTTIDFGGVVIQEGDAPDFFFDGTPSFIPEYNEPTGFGWPVAVYRDVDPVVVGRYASQWTADANGSPTVVGVGPETPVETTGDSCVKMEVQFTGPLTGPITLVDIANQRWVRYALDVAAGDQAILDTNTGRMFHAGASVSGDTSYALSGDTFMALDPLSGQTAAFQLWTGDMDNDTGFARIYWADAVLGI